VWVRRQLCRPLSALFQAVAHLPPVASQLLLQALFIAVCWEGPSHPPTPAGFVYLGLSQAPAPSLFSKVESYQPATAAVLVYLEFMWGISFSPLSGGVCHMSATVANLAHPNLSG
jgi:hypothetical protein